MIKSIKQQYIDLKEGKMTQQNFMRNLRMTMPQYITNVTSYNDSIKILKNKGILNECECDINNINLNEKNLDVDPKELQKGIEVEMEHTDDPVKAEQIALDHLAEDPQYYTKLATIEPEHSGDPSLKGSMAYLAKSLANPFPQYSKLKENAGIFNDLEQAKKEAQRMSDDEGGVAKHVDDNGDGTYSISDWYDADSTIASFGLGLDENQTEKYDNTTKKIDQSELSFLKKLYAGTPTDKIKKMIDNLEQKLKLQESKLTISGIDRAIKMLKSELKNNNVAFETDGYRVKVEDSPKVRMAVRMVKERLGMQSIKLSESTGLKESKNEKGKWINASSKSIYEQFEEINNLNGQEALIGVNYELRKNNELSKKDAIKIVLKNIKKNPIYYTAIMISGVEGYEPGCVGGKSAQPEAWEMQPVKDENIVDKKMGMKSVKNIAKPKKDADAKKETNTIVKGVEELTFTAKTIRGLKKMDNTGDKMKKISMKESIDKQYGVYELSFGQPYNFYNEEQNKFIWGDPSKATLYTKEEAEIVRKKLLKPRIDNYQRTGENYQEIHIGDLYKKRILKEQLRLQKLAGIKINEMHGEEDFKDSVISYLVDKYSDLISSKNWEELKQKIEQDFPSLSAELIIQYFEDNDVDDDIDYENMDLDGYQDVGGDSKYDEYVNEIGMNSNIHELVDKALAKERLKENIRQK